MHETHEHDTKIFSCSVCGVRLESIRTARSHFRESHSEKPLYCHLCHNTFASMIQVIIFNFTKKNLPQKKQQLFFRETFLPKKKIEYISTQLGAFSKRDFFLTEFVYFCQQVHHHLSTHHPDLVGTIVDNQPEFKCIFCGKTMNSGTFCDIQ